MIRQSGALPSFVVMKSDLPGAVRNFDDAQDIRGTSEHC
jgi:hypothetical protein